MLIPALDLCRQPGLVKSSWRERSPDRETTASPGKWRTSKVETERVYCLLIYSPAARLGLPTDFMCNNDTFQVVLDRVIGAGIQSHTIIDNVGQLVREEAETLRRHREKRNTGEISNRMNWDSYQR